MQLLSLFWTVLKVNFLTPSGPASVGLMHQECVGKFVTEEQFVQIASMARVLPGSDALQLALGIGYKHGGYLGGVLGLVAAILPPAIGIGIIFWMLSWFGKHKWLTLFFDGVLPALIATMLWAAWEMSRTIPNAQFLKMGLILILSLVALILKVPAPAVLIGAGILAVLF